MWQEKTLKKLEANLELLLEETEFIPILTIDTWRKWNQRLKKKT